MDTSLPHYHRNFVIEELILKGDCHASCSHNACETCVIGKPLKEKYRMFEEQQEGIMLQYNKWGYGENRRICRITTDLTLPEALEELNSQLNRFITHHQTKRLQAEAYKLVKASSSPAVVLMQVDFAENLTLDQQDEVQSAYYNKRQITLFTCCTWRGAKAIESTVILSDNLEHNRKTVAVYVMEIIKRMVITNSEVRLKMFRS